MEFYQVKEVDGIFVIFLLLEILNNLNCNITYIIILSIFKRLLSLCIYTCIALTSFRRQNIILLFFLIIAYFSVNLNY